jgi:hypothetical protein
MDCRPGLEPVQNLQLGAACASAGVGVLQVWVRSTGSGAPYESYISSGFLPDRALTKGLFAMRVLVFWFAHRVEHPEIARAGNPCSLRA